MCISFKAIIAYIYYLNKHIVDMVQMCKVSRKVASCKWPSKTTQARVSWQMCQLNATLNLSVSAILSLKSVRLCNSKSGGDQDTLGSPPSFPYYTQTTTSCTTTKNNNGDDTAAVWWLQYNHESIGTIWLDCDYDQDPTKRMLRRSPLYTGWRWWLSWWQFHL